MKILRLCAFLTLCAALSPLHAQPAAKLPASSPGESIAALVNGDIITKHDLEERTKLALLTSNIPDTPDMRGNATPPLLRRLIDEDLKIQAAAKERVTVTANEVSARLEAIEQQNHLPVGGLAKLLAAKGIEMEALRQQVRADIAWAKLVQGVLYRKVHVSDNAVTTRQEAIKANLGKPEYHAYEIFLSLDGAKNEAEVRDLADRLVEQVRRGAPFTAIARQFNQAGAVDGDLGWVSEGMMDDEYLAALDKLKPNEVAPPIRDTDGYHILTVSERRKVGEGMGNGSTIDMLVIDLKSLASAGQAERDLQMQHLRETLAPAKSCDDLTRLAKQAPSAAVELMEKQPESNLPANVKPLIKDLAPGQISEPIDTAKGRRFFAVCGRMAGGDLTLPSLEEIRRQMEDQQLDLLSRRYLLDLHATAIVDVRGS